MFRSFIILLMLFIFSGFTFYADFEQGTNGDPATGASGYSAIAYPSFNQVKYSNAQAGGNQGNMHAVHEQLAGQEGYQWQGDIYFSDEAVDGNSVLYYHFEIYYDSSFNWVYGAPTYDGFDEKKGLRIYKTNANGDNKSFTSVNFWGYSGNTVIAYASGGGQISPSTDQYVGHPFSDPTIGNISNDCLFLAPDQWNIIDLTVNHSDAGQSNGSMAISVNGVERSRSNIETLPFGTTLVTYGISQSTWNDGGSPSNQEFYIDNVYMSTEQNYYGAVSPPSGDTIKPSVATTDPVDTASNVSINTDLTINVSDTGGSGIDSSSIRVNVESVNYSNDLTITGSGNNYQALLGNEYLSPALTNNQLVNVDVGVSDLSQNTALTVSYSFTIESAEAATTVFAAGDAGDRNNYTEFADNWTIFDDGTSLRYIIDNTDYIEQEGYRPGEYTIFDNLTVSNFIMTGKVKSNEDLGSNISADYVLIFAWENNSNFWFWIGNSFLTSNRLFQVTNGERTEIFSLGETLVNDNDFHDFELSYIGDTLTYKHDGVQKFQLNINAAEGQVGFGGFNDSSYFDDITIQEASGGTAYSIDLGTTTWSWS